MRYLGGKSRIAKALAAEIDKVRRPGQVVWDAFCGGLSMSVALAKNGPVWSTDANAALINLYLAVQQGWDPPLRISKEDWHAAKALPDTDPRKAFCGIGCSFSGSWFSSYAAPQKGNPAHGPNWQTLVFHFSEQSARNLKKSIGVRSAFARIDFLSCEPAPTDAVLYLDPPYAGTAGYAGVGPFDSTAFVARCRQWAAFAPVFVSEYSFPIGECVWSMPMKRSSSNVRASKSPVVERLYYLPKGSVW